MKSSREPQCPRSSAGDQSQTSPVHEPSSVRSGVRHPTAALTAMTGECNSETLGSPVNDSIQQRRELAADLAATPVASVSEQASARRAGRGGFVVSLAKMYFILVGLVQQVALKAVLGLDGYGALSSALSAASITYNPLVTASLQGVSHAVATREGDGAGDALRRVMLPHAALALGTASLFLLLAPVVGGLTGAPHVVPALRLLSAVMLAYGLYAPLIGALNGRARFAQQALLDTLAATLRTAGLLGGAHWLGSALVSSDDWSGVEGASLGFAISAALILLLAFKLVRIGPARTAGPTLGEYAQYMLPILLGQGLLNLLFQADQLLLRRFASDAALAQGLPVTAADPLVGAYRATQLFCFLPYQLVIAVSVVLFPLIAASGRSGNRADVVRYVRIGVRVSLLVIGLLVSVTSGLSGPLIRLVFGNDTAELGAAPMQLLSLGLGAFALLGVLTSVLNSLSAQRQSLLVTGLACLLVVALCFWRVHGQPLGAHLLWQTALATSTALVLATLVGAVLVRRRAGGLVAASSLFRIGVALGLAIALGRALPEPSRLLTPLWAALVALGYCLVLIALGELGKADARSIRGLLGRPR
jgi:stage V sporulation protein B